MITQTEQEATTATQESQATILAIDDSETMRAMVQQTLELGGYQVVIAVDGNDGVNKFKEHSIDLVITDINMPGLDGIGLIKEIRKIDADVPILTLTTESEGSLKQRGADAGANGWIVKPLYPAQLLDLLEQILS